MEYKNKIRGNCKQFIENKEITRWVEENQNKHLCACKCGNYIQIKRVHFRTGIPEYIHGHNSIAHKEEIAETVKSFYQTEKGKKRALEHGEFMEEYYKTHEVYWKNHPIPKEMIEKQSRTKKERYASGEIIQKLTGKTFEEVYGIEKAKIWKGRISQSHTGKTGKLSCRWKGGKTKVIICEICNNEFFIYPRQIGKIKRCSNKCKGIKYSGKNSSNWEGGKSFEPYSPSFNQQLKDRIRVRDNFICQLCGIPEIECNMRLSIHHIDYNKLNCEKYNLVSLCGKCNTKVNKNREYWTKYFNNLLEKIYAQ